jgi:hypothetical protein
MKRIMRVATVAVLMLALVVGSVSPASAQGYYYPAAQPTNNGYGYGGYGYGSNDHPILRNVLIGGALVGLGFAAGRLTAPAPYAYGYGGYGHPYAHYRHW